MKSLNLTLFFLFSIHIIVNAQTICNDILAEDIDVLEYNCQSGIVSFCLPVENPNNYDIFLNSELQTEFQPCGELTQNNSYAFAFLKNSNPQIELESWSIDGNEFNGTFENLQELTDSMNIWDSPVTWEFIEAACVIRSSNSSKDYSKMIVTTNSSNGTIEAEVALNISIRPSAFSIETTIQSNYPFEIVNKVDNCVDNILIEDSDIETSIQVDCQNFAPIGATWHFQNFNDYPDGRLFSKIESDRDTTIITAQGESTLVSILEISMNGTPIPDGRLYIRESEDKVYFYEDQEFKLMYDFTLEIGDTAIVHIPKNRTYFDFFCNNEGPIVYSRQTVTIVDSVSFIENQGQQLKVLHTRSEPYYYEDCYSFGKITERIGSEFGLFGRNCSQCLADFIGHLRCYSDDLINIKLVEEDCDFGLNTSTFNFNNSDISVYPNPAKNNLFIESDVDISTFKFTDLSGRVLIQEDYINGNEIKINALNPGLYFIQLFDSKENLIYTERIIKQ